MKHNLLKVALLSALVGVGAVAQAANYPTNYPTQTLTDGHEYVLCNLASPTGYQSLAGGYLTVTAHYESESSSWYFVTGETSTPNGDTTPDEAEVKPQRKEEVIDRGGMTTVSVYMGVGEGSGVCADAETRTFWSVEPASVEGFYTIVATADGAPMVVTDGTVYCAPVLTAPDAEGMWAFVAKEDVATFEAIGTEWENNKVTIAPGEYIIQNVETGAFLGGGNDWGTHASLLPKPQYFNLEGADGVYTLDSYQYNNASAHYLATNLYVDGGSTPWTFAKVEEGVYTISNGGNYLSGDGVGSPIVTVAASAGAAAQWRLISLADIVASQDAATMDAPVDVTGFIRNPEFKRNANTDLHPTWVVTGADGTGKPSNLAYGQNDNNANCAESYHANNGFDLSQEITGLKAGVYALNAHAFYRQDGSNNDALPYVYANDEKSTFCLRTGTENSMAAAYASFLAGNYKVNTIFVEVEEGGTIKVGVHGDTNDALWNIWGEFSLAYYGNISLDDVKMKDLTATLAELKAEGAEVTGNMDAELASALATALTAEPEATVAAYEEAIATLQAAIADAKNSVNAYAAAAILTRQVSVRANAAGLDINEAVSAFQAAYSEGTLDLTEGNPVLAAYNAALAELTGSYEDVTETYIVNADFEDGSLGEAWTASNTSMNTATNKNFGILSGNIFVERWNPAPTALDDCDLTQNVTLPAGTYVLTALAQNLQQGDASVYPAGMYLYAGDARCEVSNTAGTFAVKFTLEEETTLPLGIMLSGCTGNWVCVDNFKLYTEPAPVEPFVVELNNGETAIALAEGTEVAEATSLTITTGKAYQDLTCAVSKLIWVDDEESGEGFYAEIDVPVEVAEIEGGTSWTAAFFNQPQNFAAGFDYTIKVRGFENGMFDESFNLLPYDEYLITIKGIGEQDAIEIEMGTPEVTLINVEEGAEVDAENFEGVSIVFYESNVEEALGDRLSNAVLEIYEGMICEMDEEGFPDYENPVASVSELKGQNAISVSAFAGAELEAGKEYILIISALTLIDTTAEGDAAILWASSPFDAIFVPFTTAQATAINGVQAGDLKNEIYTISGVRVSKTVKGINIINGKKVLVK